MKHWAYRATPDRVSFDDTKSLAEIGFVCRSAYPEDAQEDRLLPYLKQVSFGDVLHMHYRDGDTTKEIGPFIVCEREGHPLCDSIEDDVIARTGALYVVGDLTFLEPHNRNGGYRVDPVIGQMTGWLVKPATCPLIPYDPAHLSSYGYAVGRIPESLWPRS
jgi:hypothetical protein